jgi:hypothetical protein
VILVELIAETVAGSVMLWERLLEKSSSRPPPNSIFSEIVDIRIDYMVVKVQGKASKLDTRTQFMLWADSDCDSEFEYKLLIRGIAQFGILEIATWTWCTTLRATHARLFPCLSVAAYHICKFLSNCDQYY